MNRLLISFILLIVANNLFAEEKDSIIIFSGFVFDSDSIPVENAYLISYKTLRAFATDEKGHFDITVDLDDSLKVHHVAYQAQVIKPTEFNPNGTIYLEFEFNEIGGIDVSDYKIHEENFRTNINQMQKQVLQLTKQNYKNSKVQNPYSNNQYTNASGASLSDIIGLFRKKK
ncbi:MAG: hypothetical protein PF541_05515 [Prolixibacteraceae bacterium]|jgi:hypothetical protein|nr:hypothetical protein [Prolixibacteraceae bacterium]